MNSLMNFVFMTITCCHRPLKDKVTEVNGWEDLEKACFESICNQLISRSFDSQSKVDSGYLRMPVPKFLDLLRTRTLQHALNRFRHACLLPTVGCHQRPQFASSCKSYFYKIYPVKADRDKKRINN